MRFRSLAQVAQSSPLGTITYDSATVYTTAPERTTGCMHAIEAKPRESDEANAWADDLQEEVDEQV